MNRSIKIGLISLVFLPLAVISCQNSSENRSNRTHETQINQKSKKNETEEPITDTTSFDILNYLLKEEIGRNKKATVDYKNHTVSFKNDGDPYQVSFSMIYAADLNADQVTDYIISRDSEGMLGGNMNTNSSISYVIMSAQNQINQRHEILSYAPFSYNILDEISVKNGKLRATATQNFRTYFSDTEELESTKISFRYTDGNLYEESYLEKCELAKWKNKSFFTENSTVTRTIDMHNYTELIRETYDAVGFTFKSEISGCDNLHATIQGNCILRGNDPTKIAKKRTEFIEFLTKNSQLSTEMKQIQDYFSTHEYTEEQVELADFSFVFYSNHEKGKLSFNLTIDKNTNPNQLENWEITTRRK